MPAQCPVHHETTHLQPSATAFQETSCAQSEGLVTQLDPAVLHMQHLSEQINGHLTLLNVLLVYQVGNHVSSGSLFQITAAITSLGFGGFHSQSALFRLFHFPI